MENTCAVEVQEKEAAGAGTVEVLVGEEVYRQLEEEGFCSGWDALYDACPWGTVFQSRAFVSAWYSVYRERQLPVLVKAEQAGCLTGLLTLTLAEGSKVIRGAGDADAEYQTWLALASFGETFIKGALSKLFELFPQKELVIMYVQPQTPLSWLQSDPIWRKCLVLQALERPLMNLKDPGIAALARKKEFRKKVNALKKLGVLSFEHVQDSERFAVVLDELATQYDFRKGAKYNLIEFRNDAQKKQLFKALFVQGVLHVTLLKLGDEVVASVVASVGKKCIYLVGINTHSPFYANYSTGYVHFIMLGMYLHKDGFEVFDLTPGGDFYKNRLATTHDTVYKLCITTPLVAQFRNNISEPIGKLVRQNIKKCGLEPRKLKSEWLRAREYFRIFLGNGCLELIAMLAMRLALPRRERVYKLEGLMASSKVRACSLSDLLCFDEGGGLQTRWDFLREAERRLQVGERCFTLVEGGVLLCCAWISGGGWSDIPAGGNVLVRLYCHGGGVSLLATFLSTVAGLVAPPVYIATKDKRIQRILKKIELRPVKAWN